MRELENEEINRLVE